MLRNRTEVALVELLLPTAPDALHDELGPAVVSFGRATHLDHIIWLKKLGGFLSFVPDARLNLARVITQEG
jgi:hypothetical protein